MMNCFNSINYFSFEILGSKGFPKNERLILMEKLVDFVNLTHTTLCIENPFAAKFLILRSL